MNSKTAKDLEFEYENIKLKLLDPSPGNRSDGSGKDKKSITELANSIKEQGGILQDLIVRPHPEKKGRYEIICGERRWLAADEAGLTEAPCKICKVDDVTAREMRAIENLQREGISELEEAKNYQELMDLRDDKGKNLHTQETIAQRIGKSIAFVSARLKLLRMPDLAKACMANGKMSGSHALLVSRIPDPDQAQKATLEIMVRGGFNTSHELALDRNQDPMSYREAMKHIQDKYMRALKGAPFDPEDADLVPVQHENNDPNQPRCFGGKCSTCPFRTGNMKALFPDAKSTDVCTLTTCFAKKKSATERKERTKFADKGQLLLGPAKAKEILNYEGSQVSPDSGFIDLKAVIPGKRTTYEQALSEHLPEDFKPSVVKGKKNFVIAPVSVVAAALDAAGIKAKLPEPPKPKESYEDREKKRQVEKALGDSIAREAEVTLRQSITKDNDPKSFLILMAFKLADSNFADQHNLKDNAAVLKYLKSLDAPALRLTLAEMQLFGEHATDWNGGFEDDFVVLCEHYGVDLDKLTKAHRAKLDSKPAAKPEETAKK